MKRSASRLIRICLFLLLGAIVNVAVAWGCVLGFAPQSDGGGGLVGWHALRADQSAIMLRDLFPDAPIVQKGARGAMLSRFGWAHMCVYWSNYDDDHWNVGRSWTAAGWPVFSVVGAYMWHTHTTAESGFEGMIRVPAWAKAERRREHFVTEFLPWCPIWPGFAINTVFYAGILWLLVAAPFALRHRRRIKRGLCPACAYPVGESDVCTECGKPVTLGR